ncbi:protein phosphatase [Clostridium weizhouense]|uniref:Protein phosphatase n=1 Tax=Clostridium weizhouense TaxID=2859781 RepID=A0ABS7AT11_9CLOT|nr:protein phosphatase [Clostridium weizhouense]MBW6411794.1 protein phosphatase [Clostridium weizhouense]
MNKTSIIHSNSLINKEEFIDLFLDETIVKSKAPSINIEETSKAYYIDIYFFSYKDNFLKIYYKNNFLVFEINKITQDLNCSVKRMFYLKDINLDKSFLYHYKDKVKLIIPKIL